ncbi:MAG: BatD family protein [Bacteroidota bacterium]
MKSKILFVFFISLFFNYYRAQSFTAAVSKKTVVIGEFFQIAFTINSNANNFVPPDFKDFDIYSGPNQSTSMSFVNGSLSSSVSISYYLVPKREGKFTIGPAKISAGGKQLQSNPISIEVIKDNSNQSSANNQQKGNGSNQSGNQKYDYSTGSNGEEIFIRTMVSKQKSYIGEQITVTQKIYSSYQMRGFQNYKAPAYNGFWSKEENRTAQLSQNTENFDGRNYYVVEFNKTILFPQESGKLTINPVEIDVVAAVQSNRRPRGLFEQFFGGGYEDKVFKVKSKKIEINVSPLPAENKPAKFGGAVGNFSFNAEMDNKKVRENEPINLKLTISGKGNINLISPPDITFPSEFETYDPKINENVTVSGIVSGTKTYDYLIIPRKRGNYKIDKINFSYFDPEKKQYVNIPSPELEIVVSPGIANSTGNATVYTPKNEIEKSENDIRFIKKGNLELKNIDSEFFSSVKHYGILSGIFLIFGLALFINRRQIKLNSNEVALKEKKAAKLARKKLMNAEKLLKSNNKNAFYNEISIALNQYISDKLNIPISDLSRDNIRSQMEKRNIPEDTITNFIKTLDECEYVKYAPGAVTDNFKETYDNTISLITKIENHPKV